MAGAQHVVCTLIIMTFIIHLCESFDCHKLTIDAFPWRVTTLDEDQEDDIEDWVLTCLKEGRIIAGRMKSIEIRGFSKGYGDNLPRYAQRRAGSVHRKIIRTMRSLGYPESVIREYKKKAKLRRTFTPGFQRYQTEDEDRKVEIKIRYGDWKSTGTGTFKVKKAG